MPRAASDAKLLIHSLAKAYADTPTNLKIIDLYVICAVSTALIQDGAHYMIYTPADPLLFVAVKDLMDDPAVTDAIDEETKFTTLVEEEALHETVLGER